MEYMTKIKNYVSEHADQIKNATLSGLATIVLATAAGCATVNGIAKDTKDFAGWVADSTQKYVDRRDERELTRTEKLRQTQLDEATALINQRYKSQSNYQNSE